MVKADFPIEHPTRSKRVMGLDFSKIPVTGSNCKIFYLIVYIIRYFFEKNLLTKVKNTGSYTAKNTVSTFSVKIARAPEMSLS